MHLKPYISPECVVTMADGSYKSVAELTEGDEVQTYDMDTEEFDSANIHVNEQTSAKIIRISNIEVNQRDIIKLNLSPEQVWVEGTVDGEEGKWEDSGDGKTVTLHSQTAVMGGSGLGWLVGNQDKVIKTSPTDDTDEEMADKFHQIEAGVEIQMDYGDDLKIRKVESIETMSGDGVEPYRLIVLEDGDSVFVNDVMLGVTRQDDFGNLTSQSV
tara:strand:+ start:899 stop:1540 length:642 start_codon:yes stop_codon:yes gene_type:complete